MENLRQQTSEDKEPVDLNDLFMDMFTPEFLESLPPEQIAQTVSNLKQVESDSDATPPEWLALKNVLRARGLLEF